MNKRNTWVDSRKAKETQKGIVRPPLKPQSLESDHISVPWLLVSALLVSDDVISPEQEQEPEPDLVGSVCADTLMIQR